MNPFLVSGLHRLAALILATSILATLPLPALATQAYYIYADHLDTPRLIENQSQQVVWRWDNDDPFGGNMANENPSAIGSFEFNLRFPGQYFDKETSLHYNYFRDYSPEIGRYVQSDPIGIVTTGVPTSTTRLNHLFAYVSSNPLHESDPFGLLSAAVTACVCEYLHQGNYQSWAGWSAVLSERKRSNQWNDPVLRPCENYLYSYAAVVDYGDSPPMVKGGVYMHHWSKYLRNNTSPPSVESKEAGLEGAEDAKNGKKWKEICDPCFAP